MGAENEWSEHTVIIVLGSVCCFDRACQTTFWQQFFLSLGGMSTHKCGSAVLDAASFFVCVCDLCVRDTLVFYSIVVVGEAFAETNLAQTIHNDGAVWS